MKILRSILTLLPAVGLVVAMFLPAQTQAVNFDTFKKTYQGDWENTFDECGEIGETGTLTVVLKKIQRNSAIKAKVKKATVYFSDGSYGGLAAKGKLYQKGNKTKLRLNYGTDTITDYYLRGNITKKTLKGMYYHYSPDSGCHWNGTFDLAEV